MSFQGPVSITAGTTYVASYHTTGGRFRYTTRGLMTRIAAGNLSLLSSAESGGNGVYAYGAATNYPGSAYDASNYWVDVRFTTGSSGGGASTIFGTATPAATLTPDPAAVEVGVKVRSSMAGQIDAIRFYRQAGGNFTVSLWSSTGVFGPLAIIFCSRRSSLMMGSVAKVSGARGAAAVNPGAVRSNVVGCAASPHPVCSYRS